MEGDTKILFKLEKRLAEILLNKLESHQVSAEKASEIARFFLNELPEGGTEEDVGNFFEELIKAKPEDKAFNENVAKYDYLLKGSPDELEQFLQRFFNYLEKTL